MKPYHAGGDGASFEPYTEHLQSYKFALQQVCADDVSQQLNIVLF